MTSPEDDPAFLPLRRRFSADRSVMALVSRRAAALRLLQVDGIDLIEPTTATIDPPGMAGAILAPWPNRVDGASWWLNGHEQRLSATEPGFGHANHGLLVETDFTVREHQQDTVTLGASISMPDGYPFVLDITVAYRLCGDGIATTVTVRNLGETRAPVALGAHPYLRIGDVPTGQLRLHLHADHIWPLNGRHMPVGRRPYAGNIADVPISDSPRHATFESSDPGQSIAHALTAPDGRRVTLTADPAYRFTQLWITDALASDDGPRQAIAIEPMTAPPNALRSGVGLRWVDVDALWTTRWGIRLSSGTPPTDGSSPSAHPPEESRVR